MCSAFSVQIFLASDRIFRILAFITDLVGVANDHLHVQHTCKLRRPLIWNSDPVPSHGLTSLYPTHCGICATLHPGMWFFAGGPDNSAVGCSSNRLTKNKTFLSNINSNKTSLNSYFFRIS